MKSFQEEWKKIKEHYSSPEYQTSLRNAKSILRGKPFVLYGAGTEGAEYANILNYAECLPLCFCDKNKTGWDAVSGLSIISPARLLDDYKDTNILISSSLYRSEIESELYAMGVGNERILPKKLLLQLLLDLCSGEKVFQKKYLKRSQYLMLFNALSEMMRDEKCVQFQGCIRTYDSLEDELSRKVFLDYLKLCFIAVPVCPSPIEDQYFDPIMELSDKEVFVDCGAYTGDTAEAFMNRVDGKYKHYYAFEPDPDNYSKTEEFLKNKHDTTVIPSGLWSKETTLCFKEGYASCSKVEEEGEVTVKVCALDQYFARKEDIPTIVKMDIEGSELEALKGAEVLIRSHKPKLAICIYHKPEDMYEIPDYIRSIREDYRFYVRHYTDTFDELVLYAI